MAYVMNNLLIRLYHQGIHIDDQQIEQVIINNNKK